jgi:hypothetical protein
MKGSRLVYCILIVLVDTCLSGQHVVFDADDVGGGYKDSTWFAQYNAEHYPWIHHEDHGWMFVAKAETDQIWLWDPAVGWFWTTPDAYPVLFNDLSGWVDYLGIEDDHRNFWDFSTREVLTDVQNPEGVTYFPVPGPMEAYEWKYEVNNKQPIAYTEPDLNLTMTFESMDIHFGGNSLVRTTTMDADVDGTGLIEGTWYPLDGIASIGRLEHIGWNTLGLYQTHIDALMFIQITVMGITFETRMNAKISGFDEILVGFPWKGDLYNLPVGTVYTQASLSGLVEGDASFNVIGFPELDEYDSFSTNANSPIDLRFEIVAKYPEFQVEGRNYNRVVKVACQVDEVDPSTGLIVSQLEYRWFAPGIGMIMAEAMDPGLDETFLVELIDCNLW